MTTSLRSSLAALGTSGVRLALADGRLVIRRPDALHPDALAPLRTSPDAAKAAVARIDAELVEALAVLDELASRPGTSPARLEVIRLRAEVYREYRERLDPTDLAGDARHFVHCILNPAPRDHDWLHPRDCRESPTTQETRP